MERKLATVQTIKALNPIEGADRIETATFESVGWACVVKKGEFKPGDLCAYFELDSIVPETAPFAFLQGKRRIKTQRLRGQLSQGLALPLKTFVVSLEEASKGNHLSQFIIDYYNGLTIVENVVNGEGKQLIGVFEIEEDGTDLTEVLGVEKYEPPQSGQPGCKSGPPPGCEPFPLFLGFKKTDEVRIQSEPKLLESLQGKPYTITVKLDGQSGTFAKERNSGELFVCSRNLRIKERGFDNYWRVLDWLGLEEWLEWNDGVALQGEVCGPGIHGNKLGLQQLDFFVFSVFDLATKQYLNPVELASFAAVRALKTVPLVEKGKRFNHTQESLLKLAEGLYPGTHNQRQGIVVRSNDGLISFKVISNAFLEKNHDE